MQIATKIDALSKIYDIYDAFSKGLTVACERGCATCCTDDVIMTALEGYCILGHLIDAGKMDLLEGVRSTAHQSRFQPAITTNDLAALCLQGEDPPEERSDYSRSPCQFLSNKECLIYQVRPFGCRCFFSTQKCEEAECAVVDPFVVTVNTVFLQFIEHIDAGGFFGNMTDVLLFLESETQRRDYETQASTSYSGSLARNRAIPALVVPPEHQSKLQPILDKLKKTEISVTV
ncbi:MAG: hypothetical protein HWN68_18735 [Desulfobacterales bacterium]|nr:hypothetical protein [Desulfobacterales bacterium]